MIFVVLTPGLSIDLETYLGGMLPISSISSSKPGTITARGDLRGELEGGL